MIEKFHQQNDGQTGYPPSHIYSLFRLILENVILINKLRKSHRWNGNINLKQESKTKENLLTAYAGSMVLNPSPIGQICKDLPKQQVVNSLRRYRHDTVFSAKISYHLMQAKCDKLTKQEGYSAAERPSILFYKLNIHPHRARTHIYRIE